LEWLTLLPLTGRLPQTAHCCAKAICYLRGIRVTFEIGADSNMRSIGLPPPSAALDPRLREEL
jgi:hypothetical protein